MPAAGRPLRRAALRPGDGRLLSRDGAPLRRPGPATPAAVPAGSGRPHHRARLTGATLERSQMLIATQHSPIEWSYTSHRAYADPANEVEVDVIITDPDGAEQRVPAFWSGEQSWRVRYAPAQPGCYRY